MDIWTLQVSLTAGEPPKKNNDIWPGTAWALKLTTIDRRLHQAKNQPVHREDPLTCTADLAPFHSILASRLRKGVCKPDDISS